MIGSAGERMLDITMPYAQSWNAWYAWFGNRPEGLAPWMEVDRHAAVGRDPETSSGPCAVTRTDRRWCARGVERRRCRR